MVAPLHTTDQMSNLDDPYAGFGLKPKPPTNQYCVASSSKFIKTTILYDRHGPTPSYVQCVKFVVRERPSLTTTSALDQQYYYHQHHH